VTLLLGVAGLAVAAFLADRLLLWMEWKGWIAYRRTYPGRFNSGQVGPAFLAIQGLLEPEKRHAAEEQTALRTEQDDEGGPGDAPHPFPLPPGEGARRATPSNLLPSPTEGGRGSG
jgi:hypothetical protein